MKPILPPLIRRLVLVLPVLILTGCLNLKPATDPARHFLLSSPLPAPAEPLLKSGPTSFGLGRVILPDYLDNPSFAVRKSDSEIAYVEDYIWAERLDLGVDRVMAINLTKLLGTDRLYFGEWLRGMVDYEVHPVITRFEPDINGQVQLSAFWKVTLPGGTRVVDAGQVAVELPGPKPSVDPTGSLQVMSQALVQWSRELHAQIGKLPATRTEP